MSAVGEDDDDDVFYSVATKCDVSALAAVRHSRGSSSRSLQAAAATLHCVHASSRVHTS